MMDASKPPFSCTFTPALAELLAQLGCSLALSTYQAGKVLLVSSNGERLTQLPRTFDTPMGMAYHAPGLAVACKHQVTLLANDPRLGWAYPRKPRHYDAFFVPRSSHYCGQLNIHDIAFTPTGGLVGVNTLFSCLFELDAQFSFRPIWQPPFISALAPEDRCHLNGMAMLDGKPKYVTAQGTGDAAGSWRPDKLSGGVLIDVDSNAIVLHGLAMPHSPRIWDGELYMLLSATGEVVKADLVRGSYDVIARIPAFIRGMARHGDYLFIGCSMLRKTHTFGDLPLAKDSKVFCGMAVIHLPTGAYIGDLRYINSCEEIYDVQLLPGIRRPGILGTESAHYQEALSLPEATYWGQGVYPSQAEPK
jgi:uncharacterized protein (TIGR03032 family)